MTDWLKVFSLCSIACLALGLLAGLIGFVAFPNFEISQPIDLTFASEESVLLFSAVIFFALSGFIGAMGQLYTLYMIFSGKNKKNWKIIWASVVMIPAFGVYIYVTRARKQRIA